MLKNIIGFFIGLISIIFIVAVLYIIGNISSLIFPPMILKDFPNDIPALIFIKAVIGAGVMSLVALISRFGIYLLDSY